MAHDPIPNKKLGQHWLTEGLNFKLDVGLYRLDQQVACQRIGKTLLDAKS
jgi:hypothetical protein